MLIPDRQTRLIHVQTARHTCTLVFYLSVVHDQDAVCVQHAGDAVGDGEHGAVPEGISDGVLDQSVCLRVDGRGGLVQEDDLLGQTTGGT